MKEFKLSKRSEKNIEGVRQSIITLVKRVLKKSPHDFGIPKYGGKRTPQEQNDLYNSTTQDGKRLTWLDGYIKLSYHQSGNAFDIFIYDEHGACWKCIDKYQQVAQIFKKEFDLMKEEGLFKHDENIYWGGDWTKFKDLPHFEVKKY